MTFLVIPARISDEGPWAFRFRLAKANLLSVRELGQFEIESALMPSPQALTKPLSSTNGTPWVQRRARFCPSCLGRRGCWLVGWEILFADACAECGNWLVDTCTRCASLISWQRTHLMRCICGKYLPDEETCAAPGSVVYLSRTLQSIGTGRKISRLSVLRGLRLTESVRLIRLLGTYGNSSGCNWPQKVIDVDTLRTSWPITSIAAEILATWPTGFFQLLEKLRDQSTNENRGRLSKAFQGFYSALYKGFFEPEFDFLRTEFENYVTEHWTGAIGKRNRRMDEAVLGAMSWIPANHACQILHVSRRRLNSFIENGSLLGERRVTVRHREFVVVKKVDVESLSFMLHDGITLTDVAVRMGITKRRLLRLLPVICPMAKKIGPVGCPWAIPSSWIERWETILRIQQHACPVGLATVTMGHVIRYWSWTNDQIGLLLVDIWAGNVRPIGVTDGKGVGTLIFSVDLLSQWCSENQGTIGTELSIPEVALRFAIKQEVVYTLIRSGLLVANVYKVGRRSEQRVRVAILEEFEGNYVLCRDIAKLLQRSPRAVAKFLLTEHVRQVAGPGVDKCRQIFFRRDEADNCLRRNGLGALPVTSEWITRTIHQTS